MSQETQIKKLRQNILNLSAVLVIFFTITACVCRQPDDKPSQPTTPQPTTSSNQATRTPDPNRSTSNNAAGKRNDDGDFIVEHVPVQNARYTDIDKQVKDEKLLERAADKLNANLMLPYDLTLRTKDCGETNAFYNPADHSVTICYELMEHFFKIFKSTGKTDQQAYDKMFDAIRFAFLHELGHAVIDAYKLPIMGNEEDAADRCSSYICLTELGDEGIKATMAAADAFAIESKDNSPNSRSMADEHLLQEQRFYNTLCMVYGSDTNKYDFILKEQYLPRERAVRCPSEFQRTVQSWHDLFEPWRKN